jgi:hypothetical protein
MKKVIISINDVGEISLEADGFRDSQCLKALSEIQKAFGDVLEERHKPEAMVNIDQKITQ